MYFLINTDIKIGDKRFRGVNEMTIKESIHEIATTCIIKIPATSVLVVKSETQTASGYVKLDTAKQFKVGDKVLVKAGYSGTYQQMFVGFVSQLNLTSPAEIECEGYSWQLRKKKNIKKSWANTTLIDVLKEVISGTDIKLHDKIPAIPLKNLVINNASGLQVIEYLVELLKGTLTAYFIDNVLYVGLTYIDAVGKTVKYRLGGNTISDQGLRYHKAEDLSVKIEFKFKGSDGNDKTNDPVGVGGGVVRKETVTAVSEEKWLTEMAKAKLKQETFDGYEGTIDTFLVPFCRAGYRAEVDGGRYEERGGNYFVESVEISIGQGGGRITPELGLKLS